MLAVVVALLPVLSSCKSDSYATSFRENFPKPETSLASAIRTAQKQMPEGRCIVASLGRDDIFLVTLFGNGMRRDVKLDPRNGSLISTSQPGADANMQSLVAELGRRNPGIDALEAVESAAKAQSDYWPLAVELGHDHGLVYQVLLAKGNKAKIASVSSANGRVESLHDIDPAH